MDAVALAPLSGDPGVRAAVRKSHKTFTREEVLSGHAQRWILERLYCFDLLALPLDLVWAVVRRLPQQAQGALACTCSELHDCVAAIRLRTARVSMRTVTNAAARTAVPHYAHDLAALFHVVRGPRFVALRRLEVDLDALALMKPSGEGRRGRSVHPPLRHPLKHLSIRASVRGLVTTMKPALRAIVHVVRPFRALDSLTLENIPNVGALLFDAIRESCRQLNTLALLRCNASAAFRTQLGAGQLMSGCFLPPTLACLTFDLLNINGVFRRVIGRHGPLFMGALKGLQDLTLTQGLQEMLIDGWYFLFSLRALPRLRRVTSSVPLLYTYASVAREIDSSLAYTPVWLGPAAEKPLVSMPLVD